MFDTNLVSYWLLGEESFRPPLMALIRQLSRRKAALYISAVTLQELMVFSRLNRNDQGAYAAMTKTFTTLVFDERAAIEAARIGAARPLDRKTAQLERDVWQRDIAILGTASAHEMDVVITANGRDFLGYQDDVACDIHIVEPVRRRGS